MDKDKTPTVLKSMVIYNNTLYEQVYLPDRNQSYYIGWDDKKNEPIPRDYLEFGNMKYLPIHDDLLQKRVVILPTEPMEYDNEEELEFEISCFIKTWLDISEEHLQKATWYAFLTRLTDKINTIPYLRALGDYGCGKTRYLDVIGGLCYKPMFIGGSVRSAPIYRVIDLWRGTAIFDEFTLKKSDESEDIIQILNNGYQKNKPVLRCKDGNYDKVIPFDPFGPKVLATRNRFYDTALESRCITEIMTTTGRTDIPIDLTESFHKQLKELQNKLLMYRLKNWDKINTDDTLNIDFGNILPRIKQSLIPFTVLFQYNNKRLTEFIKYTQDFNRKIIEENSMSFDGQIINAYINLVDNHNDEQQNLDDYHEPHITSTDIRNYFIDVEGWDGDHIKASTIGRKIKTLGFDVTPRKIAGKTKKIITINDERFRQLRQKYVVTEVSDVTAYTDEVKNNKKGDNT